MTSLQLHRRGIIILLIGAGLVTFAVTRPAGSRTESVVGLVVSVDGDLTTVRTFEVLAADGARLVFRPSPTGRFDFPLPHLSTHMTTLDPVRVDYYTDTDGTLYATGLTDA